MKLSVIIPVYNTEKYLEKCLNSILVQEYKDLEIILIDDGSTDSSPLICDSYASQYSNVKVTHITNSGPATAKNIGYSISKGEYISFIDSDDELQPTMFQKMISSGETHQADIICCSYIQIDENGILSHQNHTHKEYIMNQEEALKHFLDKDLIYSQCWTKIYRRKLLDTNHIKFIDGLKTEEDIIYNLTAFLHCQMTTVIDEPLYIYTYRNSSLSREYYLKNHDLFLKNLSYRLKLTESIIIDKHPKLIESCTIHCLNYYNFMFGRTTIFGYQKSKFYCLEAHRYMKHHASDLIHNHQKCGFSKIGAYLCIILPTRLYFYYRKFK